MNPYDKYAQRWTDDVRSSKVFSHNYIEKPAMLAKLPDLNGKRVLCVGCGSGDECKELANRGAIVVGIDNSVELIKIAQRDFPGIEFHVMDMEQIELPAESFDFIYSSLTLHYKEHWVKTLKSIARLMKPEAPLLFSTIHPATWAAETIDEGDRKARLLGYQQEGDNIVIHGDYLTTRLLHDKWWGYFDVSLYTKSLSEIFSEVKEAGLEVSDFLEPRAISEGQEADPMQYARYQKLPFFAIFELRKH